MSTVPAKSARLELVPVVSSARLVVLVELPHAAAKAAALITTLAVHNTRRRHRERGRRSSD
jgi:hypothetical protein